MYAEHNNRIVNSPRVRDLALRIYNERQLNEIDADNIYRASTKVLPAGKFSFYGREWIPNEYKGYAVVSMLNDNPVNEALTEVLIDIQNQLFDNLQPFNKFYMLPPDSFHQTVANTLSAEKFKENILYAGLELSYPTMVEEAFDHIVITKQISPIRMRIVGLSVFGTSIGVLGTFEIDADYKRILDFRAGLYEDRQLAKLNIKMTRPFIGHITLAYIEHKLNIHQREHLANTINEINDEIFAKRYYFNISHTGLRYYNHLAEFKTAPDFPVYQFTL